MSSITLTIPASKHFLKVKKTESTEKSRSAPLRYLQLHQFGLSKQTRAGSSTGTDVTFSGGDDTKCLFRLLEKGRRSSSWMLTRVKSNEKITTLTAMLTWTESHGNEYSVPFSRCLCSMFIFLPEKILGKRDGHFWSLFWDNNSDLHPLLGVIHDRAILRMDGGGQHFRKSFASTVTPLSQSRAWVAIVPHSNADSPEFCLKSWYRRKQ